jgi:hypothetical protein
MTPARREKQAASLRLLLVVDRLPQRPLCGGKPVTGLEGLSVGFPGPGSDETNIRCAESTALRSCGAL